MTFLDQEITFDMGHLVLLAGLVIFIIFVASRCSLSCGKNNEQLQIQPVKWKSCRCPDCAKVAYQKAVNGELYGCDPNNPFVPYGQEECNYQYRQTALNGCGVA